MKMTIYQVKDYARVVLVDTKTYRTIENCTKVAVGDDEEGRELINCRSSCHRYGDKAMAIPWDEMPSEGTFRTYTRAFVQLAGAIAYTLEHEETIPLVYCRNGRSRSPCVIAAFFILYRGLTVEEIEVWFNETYPAQRPETARASTVFPNLDKFKNVLLFLEICSANPEETKRGFNLAACVADCSELLGYQLTIAARAPFIGQSTSMRDNAQRPSPPSRGVVTRSTRRQTANVVSSRNIGEPSDGANEAPSVESENRLEDEAAVALMNLGPGVAQSSLANLDPLCFAPSMRHSPLTREGEVRVRGESDNENDARSDAEETSENPALGEQDGDSDSVTDNISGAGAAAVNENAASREQDEDGESGAADNFSDGGGGGGGGDDDDDDDAGGTVANEISASGEQDEDSEAFNINGADDGANENAESSEEDEVGERSVADNINGSGGGAAAAAAAAGGTGAVLFFSSYEAISDTSGPVINPRGTRCLSSEVLAQRGPITFEIGGFQVTAAVRGQGGSSRQRTQSSSRSTAIARSPPRSNSGEDRNVRRRMGRELPLTRNRQNVTAADSRRRWVALPVPEHQEAICPFCQMDINPSYRSLLPCFDKCIEINGNDSMRRGIYRHHSSRVVTGGDSHYYCWPYGILTSRGFCDQLVKSLGIRDGMNDEETMDLIRFVIVGVSFIDTDKFSVVIEEIFSAIEGGTHRDSSDEMIMMEYITGWEAVLGNKTERNNYVRYMQRRFGRFVGEVTRKQLLDIIDDEVRQSVLLLRDQVEQHAWQDDNLMASSHLESIITNWLSSSVVSNGGITEIMKTSLAKTIFHRLDSIRKTSETWRNRRRDE